METETNPSDELLYGDDPDALFIEGLSSTPSDQHWDEVEDWDELTPRRPTLRPVSGVFSPLDELWVMPEHLEPTEREPFATVLAEVAAQARKRIETTMRTPKNSPEACGDGRTNEHSALTPSQRTQRARITARARWSQQSGLDGTAAAREAFLARFERQVDPDGVLPPAERLRRAESAKREHFQRLAYLRHKAS